MNSQHSRGGPFASFGLYEQAHPSDPDIARYLLFQVLGQVGEDVDIRPPLRVDYGYNITIGDGSWVNFGLTASMLLLS